MHLKADDKLIFASKQMAVLLVFNLDTDDF